MIRALWLLLVITCLPCVAAAHEVGLSQGRYARQGGVLEVEVVLAQRDAAALSSQLDPDQDGRIDARDIDSARAQLEQSLLGSITVGELDGACVPALTHVAITERDGLLLKGQLRCPPGKEPWRVTLGFVSQLSRGHRHTAHIGSGPRARDELLYGDAPSLEIGLDGAASGNVERPGGARGFLMLGFEHILGGYDHLVFLVALVLAGGTRRSLLAVVTAFTVGHSLSLALATCGVWAPTPVLIEPGIALSIGYVALENLRGLDPGKRWRVTFPFGLLHGFGFSGALLDVGLTRAEIPSALFFFNAGVELGQIGLLAVTLPLVHALRGWARLPRGVWPALNVCVAALSVVWFVQRVTDGELWRRAHRDVAQNGLRLASPPGSVQPLRLAQQLCEALHALPGRRSAECCEAPPSKYLYDECVDVVSRSLASGAIALDANAVTACERAMNAQLAGCDWVRPGLPLAPEACQGLIQGQVESGGACRSSLECASNNHCVVAAGAARGRCVPPASLGATCGRSTDALAAYVLERTTDTEHPVCADFCSLVSHQCEPKPEEGAACRATINCASGQQCVQGACRSGAVALQLSSTGQACRADFECARGGCVASGASDSGVCGKRCSTRVPE